MLALDAGPDAGVDALETAIAAAIKWKLRLNPRHELVRNPNTRQELAKDIIEVASEYGHDPWLITAMAYCESTFRPHAIGDSRGERGIMQLHGRPTRGCEFDTARGGLECGARYLRLLTDRCGSVERGVAAYATGRCKLSEEEKAMWTVRRRLRMAERLRGRFGG